MSWHDESTFSSLLPVRLLKHFLERITLTNFKKQHLHKAYFICITAALQHKTTRGCCSSNPTDLRLSAFKPSADDKSGSFSCKCGSNYESCNKKKIKKRPCVALRLTNMQNLNLLAYSRASSQIWGLGCTSSARHKPYEPSPLPPPLSDRHSRWAHSVWSRRTDMTWTWTTDAH